MVNDFLFELGCEELPSGAVWPLADALTTQLRAALDKAQINYGECLSFATPRRLAVLIKAMQAEQPSQATVRRGPARAAAFDAKNQPTQALLGFAKSCGVGVSDLTTLKTEKGEWLIYESLTKGAKTIELLPAMLQQILTHLPIAKPMRWGNGAIEFVRPVHWAIVLYGNEVIPCTILGLKASSLSFGHRFHHPHSLKIASAADYEALLREAYVIADFHQRRNLIIEQINTLAAACNAKAIMPDSLLDEVTSIVEWPEALLANFEQNFLEVPAEALIASMQGHQKCFAMQDSKGQLLPHFITVANISSTNPQQVIAGNEKVMRARLSDAAFFFSQDKKQSLSELIPATEKVIFQVKLGSLKDKAKRLQQLMSYLVAPLQLNEQEASRAAELSKCDLMTGMVGEFPELQGLMGYYYACHDGESKDVALALNEQYMPRFASDNLPASNLGLALSLAERLDTLVGIFAIGQKPSGVKDPFKLRRHALAVVRMLVSTPAQLSLSDLIAETWRIYGNQLPQGDTLLNELKPFILERMQSYFQSLGFSVDLILAVRARQDDWLSDFNQRIRALALFIKLPQAAALSAACKRVNNLLQHAGQQSDQPGIIDKNLLKEPAEKNLLRELEAMEQEVKPLYASESYDKILNELANLREPVDAFFEQVMVMVDDMSLKTNRLNLLTRLQALLQGVADISLLQLNL